MSIALQRSLTRPIAPFASTSATIPSEEFWPLPLTAYEQYMFLDDRPSHPMTFCIELLFEGTLDRSTLSTALDNSLKRHPLLRAVIQKRFLKQPCWVPAQQSPAVAWLNTEAYQQLERPDFLDVTREPGLRLWVIDDPAEPRLLFQFHHASVDGVGALEFIGDLLAYYGQMTTPAGEEKPELDPVHLEKLKRRGRFYGTKVTVREWLPGFIRHTWDTVSSFPKKLSRNQQGSDTTQKPLFPPFVTRILENEDLQAVKKVAACRGATPNEIYTTVMLQTYYRWNLKQQGRVSGWARMCMPISLRSPDQDNIPSANIISYLMLNRRQADLADFDATLKFVHARSHDVIGTSNGPIFVQNLTFLLRIPLLMRVITRLPICFSTGVLANVGDVKRQFRGRFPMTRGKVRAGSLVMTGLLGAAPVRPGSGVATSVGTYARQLFINMNFDPGHFSKADAEELIDMFVAGLRELFREKESA